MSTTRFRADWFFGTRQYRHLLADFYQQYGYEQRYVQVDGSHFSQMVQRDLHVDTVVQKDALHSLGIEEKIVKWPKSNQAHTAFFLETRSCTNQGHESPGWMTTCQADLLFYAFELKDVGLLVYLLDFPRLQRWFWQQYLPHLPHPAYGQCVMPTENRTEGRLVSIAAVVAQVPTRCYRLPFTGGCEPLPLITNPQRFRNRFLLRKPHPAGAGQNYGEPAHPEDRS